MSMLVARQLRKRMSPPEARMWNLLRVEPMRSWHFRRQVPFGPYYADFASHSAKLIIEVDGDTHGSDEARDYDTRRDRFLSIQGYRVVRVFNRDVMNNLDGIGEYLAIVLAASPTRPLRGHPPHKGEGKGSH